MLNRTLTSALAGSALALGLMFSGSVSAAAVYCSVTSDNSSSTTTPAPDNLSTGDVTFGVLGVTPVAADDCYGIADGNNVGNNAPDLSGLFPEVPASPWTLLVTDNTPDNNDLLSSNFEGIQFTLDAEPEGGAASGTWTLSWLDVAPLGDLPRYFDFMVVLKASNNFAAYSFDEEYLTADNSPGAGTFDVKIANNQGVFQDLSHMSIYSRLGTTTTSTSSASGGQGSTSTSSSTTSGGQGVAEPNMLALLGAGLLGGMLAARRRRRNSA